MVKLLRLAVLLALCGAVTGCSGTALYNVVYGYKNPHNWLDQASSEPWIQQHVALSPLTPMQAGALESLALQECVGPSYVLRITMGQSPEAQAQRQQYGQSQQGWQLYGAVAPAYAVLLITARRGDVQAQAHLADFYAQKSQDFVNSYGPANGTYNPYAAYGALEPPQNHPRNYLALSAILRHAAVKWANEAAMRGLIDGRSDFDLGMLYQRRAGAGQLNYPAKLWNRPAGFRRANMTTALHWYKLSAGQGYAATENCLGDIYSIGAPGITPNPARAFHWYRLAAAQGVPNAEYQLALAYRHGWGTSINLDQSTAWLNLAVAAKWPPAIALAAHIFMEPVVAAAQRGNAAVQLHLALAYYNGRYQGHAIPQNYVKAAYWFKKCAPRGNVLAEFYMGRCDQAGLGVAVNYAQAARWYHLAAKQGNASAENNLGVMFARGEYYAKNDILAAKWYNLAAGQGCTLAATNLQALLQQDVVRSPNNQQLEQELLQEGIALQTIQQANERQQQMFQEQSLQQQAEIQAQWNAPDEDDAPPPEPGGD